MLTYPVGTLNPNVGGIPTDYIHAYLFDNNLLDSGSVGNDLIQSSGVIADIMTTNRHGAPNSAMRSSNSAIVLALTSTINWQKGWSLNWWQLVDGTGAENVNVLYKSISARYARSTSVNFQWRPNVGTTVIVPYTNYITDIWQNFHVNYGNGILEVFIDNVSQGTGNNTDHTTPLVVSFVGTNFNVSSPDISLDDVLIFNRLLDSGERQAIADS